MQTMDIQQDTILNYEHADWLKAIEFYKDDLAVLQKRLAEVTLKNTRQAVLEGVEHFQNQFLVQKNNLDELRHYVHEHIIHVQQKAGSHAQHPEKDFLNEHEQRKDEFNSIENTMKTLRREFNAFLAKWM